MARLQDEPHSKVAETLRVLTQHSSFTAELGEQIRKGDGATRAVNAMVREFFQPPSPEPAPSFAQDEPPPSRAVEVFSERFRINVTYTPVPSASELRKRFNHVGFGEYTHNEWVREGWLDRKECQNGTKNLLVRSYGVKMRSDEVLRQALRKGYRLGLLEEALSLADACPDFQRRCRIVVLGSTMLLRCRSVAVLCGDRNTRELRTSILDTLWDASDCFLLVEDEEKKKEDLDVKKFLENFPGTVKIPGSR